MPNKIYKQYTVSIQNNSTFKWMSMLLKTIVIISIILPLWSCSDDDDTETPNWRLVWQDEFDGPAGQLPSSDNWVFDIGRGPDGDGWGNRELQSYTNNPDNVSLDGQGNLNITALNAGGFTSARITTKGKFEQRYGRFEARIKLPYGPGLWPAFWMLGSNIDQVDWPQCGEIDIMEFKGQEPNIIHGSMHGPGYSKDDPITKTYGLADSRFDYDFHIFAIEWSENAIDYYVDDVLYQRIKKEDVPGEWVFNQPFYILLNFAVGGSFVGFPSIDTEFPKTMVVDYVNVYQDSSQ